MSWRGISQRIPMVRRRSALGPAPLDVGSFRFWQMIRGAGRLASSSERLCSSMAARSSLPGPHQLRVFPRSRFIDAASRRAVEACARIERVVNIIWAYRLPIAWDARLLGSAADVPAPGPDLGPRSIYKERSARISRILSRGPLGTKQPHSSVNGSSGGLPVRTPSRARHGRRISTAPPETAASGRGRLSARALRRSRS